MHRSSCRQAGVRVNLNGAEGAAVPEVNCDVACVVVSNNEVVGFTAELDCGGCAALSFHNSDFALAVAEVAVVVGEYANVCNVMLIGYVEGELAVCSTEVAYGRSLSVDMEGDIPLPVFARFFGECVGGVHTVVVELSFNAYDKVGPVVLTEVVVAGELTVGDTELVAGVGVPEALGAYAVVSDNAEFVAVGVEERRSELPNYGADPCTSG